MGFYWKNILSITASLLLVLFVSCNPYHGVPESYHQKLDEAFKKAGKNKLELKQIFELVSEEQKKAAAFLLTNMPERDLKNLTAGYLQDNINWALKIKTSFPWSNEIPDSIFLNDVLPYAVLNERRDNWREDFYTRFSKYVNGCKTIEEAIDSVNKNIMNEVKVVYSTERPKADQSPFESMDCGLASCTGLSILLVDAFRSVGIPARLAGTPLWTTVKGNHSWVEVWIRGEWYFTEYYPGEALNRSWFVERAGKANPEKPIYWIYASSFKKRDIKFPLVWDEKIDYVFAENVTSRYIELYHTQKMQKANNENKVIVSVHLFKEKDNLKGDNRISQQICILSENDTITRFKTAHPEDDMNNFREIFLKKKSDFTIHYFDNKGFKQLYIFHTDISDFRINLFIDN
ncbi:MAG: transglutaminase domain-containing protein [Bacteroidetes bacterium]|nr:MAG: transglutaminase domain-containing protein [Bacteroidota bacterium]